jgi:hypothetical protein
VSWQLSGRFHEFCNCDLLCPCLFDVTARPDQGWCGSVLAFDIERGGSDGVDLAGRTAVMAVNIPGTFAEGNFTARLYVDDGADEPQQRALEQIFTGQQGGPWEVVAPAFAQWLPTKTVPITVQWDDKTVPDTVQWGDKPEIVIGDVGRLVSDPRVDPSGRPTLVDGAEAVAAFEFGAPIQPARTLGSHFADPDLRGFEGNSGYMGTFRWTV